MIMCNIILLLLSFLCQSVEVVAFPSQPVTMCPSTTSLLKRDQRATIARDAGPSSRSFESSRLMQVTSYRRQQLPVYMEPGDPYAEPVSHLRDGEVILATKTVDFAGQVWVRFTVDESQRGVYHGEEPKNPFVGWATAELRGHRWLLEVQPPEFTEPTNSGGRALSSFLRMPTKIPRCNNC